MAPTISTDRLRAQIDCFNPEAKSTKELKIVIKNLIEADHLRAKTYARPSPKTSQPRFYSSGRTWVRVEPSAAVSSATYWCTEV
jgi:hypothetical protein